MCCPPLISRNLEEVTDLAAQKPDIFGGSTRLHFKLTAENSVNSVVIELSYMSGKTAANHG
jgi:hypothetical protein